MTKPYFGILIIPILLQREWKVLVSLSITLALSPLTVLPFAGTNTIDLYREWFVAMMHHGSYLTSPHYIGYYLSTFLDLPINGIIYPTLFALLILAPTLFYVKNSFHKRLSPHAFLLLGWTLYALVPNLVITDTEHFLASTPLIIFCVSAIAVKKNVPLSILFSLCALGFALNSRHFLTDSGMRQYEFWGILGICNLGIILIAAILSKNLIPDTVNNEN